MRREEKELLVCFIHVVQMTNLPNTSIYRRMEIINTYGIQQISNS